MNENTLNKSANRPIQGDMYDEDHGMEFEQNQNQNEASSSKVESAEKRDSVLSLHSPNNDYKTPIAVYGQN